tara:strand:- start:23 stop:211 length:189 start_codon:yes stop_codon:yes gene_type:complete
MPLRKGSDPATIAANVRQLVKEGYPPLQATAIAHATAEAGKPKAAPKAASKAKPKASKGKRK